MRLQKLGHACVRLTKDGATLVLDPGSLTEPEALIGADAVLVTHEHPDHLDPARLAAALETHPGLEIWTNAAVSQRLGEAGGVLASRVHAVGQDDSFVAAGFDVRVYGEQHAVIHPDLPVVANVGFLVDGEVFHPGDAFTVPDVGVGTLLVPSNAPWLKAWEMIDYVREVRPRRAYSIHDGLVNEHGLALVDGFLARLAGDLDADVRRLAPGDGVEVA
jgi:L-ascorbate metabolism protein UlaG (beta-lactamase superfamily)